MKEFIAKFGDRIKGVLSGFDRLVFRGPLRGISYVSGRERHLWANPVRKQECGEQAEKVREQLKEASLADAGSGRRPVSGIEPDQPRRGRARHRCRGAEYRRAGVRAKERGTVREL
jgi:hypothetical protein